MRKLSAVLATCLVACASKKPAEDTPRSEAPHGATKTASAFSPAPGEWEVYLSKINDAPASVMVNLWFNEKAPMKGFGQLLWVFIKMETPGEHGMGVEAEGKSSGPLEDALSAHIQTKLTAHYVGRIRGNGEWQLYFYCPSPSGFKEAVDALMKAYPARKYTLGNKPDESWNTYRTVLYPDEENLSWIMDNRVVENLRRQGDPLTEARRVDHWIYFENEASRGRFEAAARAAGFAVQDGSKTKTDQGQFGIQIYRTDFVDIDRIRAVIKELKDLAQKHGGDYDGWETAVTKAAPAKAPN